MGLYQGMLLKVGGSRLAKKALFLRMSQRKSFMKGNPEQLRLDI